VRAEAEAEKIAEQLKKTKVSGCTLFTFFLFFIDLLSCLMVGNSISARCMGWMPCTCYIFKTIIS
jgi:NADH:ubiquinone oxidoreductase subunit 6 (subunit J)